MKYWHEEWEALTQKQRKAVLDDIKKQRNELMQDLEDVLSVESLEFVDKCCNESLLSAGFELGWNAAKNEMMKLFESQLSYILKDTQELTKNK